MQITVLLLFARGTITDIKYRFTDIDTRALRRRRQWKKTSWLAEEAGGKVVGDLQLALAPASRKYRMKMSSCGGGGGGGQFAKYVPILSIARHKPHANLRPSDSVRA